MVTEKTALPRRTAPCSPLRTSTSGANHATRACVDGEHIFVSSMCIICRIASEERLLGVVAEMTPAQLRSAQRLASLPTEPLLTKASDWDAAIALGRLALGHELVGAMRTMVDLAREHALGRIQFGRPIAGFQAVRHRLAESLVAVEAADAALDGAWHDGTPLGAAVAKAVAGHRAKEVRRHSQQVLAGIGFTTEHDLHLYVRRVLVLDRVLGDARSLTRRLGEQLLADRSVPAILPL